MYVVKLKLSILLFRTKVVRCPRVAGSALGIALSSGVKLTPQSQA